PAGQRRQPARVVGAGDDLSAPAGKNSGKAIRRFQRPHPPEHFREIFSSGERLPEAVDVMPQSWTQSPNVAVVGGGLAGLAAACALASSGFKVTLFERRPYLGGRASSYQHPGTGEVIDNCQHVLLGCCTNLIDYYERTGVAGSIRWFERLTFLEPGGRASEIGPSLLPAPLHTTPAFLRATCLEIAD